ncbi:MAG TPA: GNAT family N-acetyltransferase [Steroidobacteraceae bacterium]
MLNELTMDDRSRDPAVIAESVTARDRWDRLLAQVSLPHFTQSWCYGEGKRSQGWAVERLQFAYAGEAVAICQVLVKRVLGLPVAARINRGPLFLGEASPEVQLTVLQALRQRWRYGRRGLLLMAPSLPFDAASTSLLRAAGFTSRKPGGWGSALIDLHPSLDAIRAGLSSKWRNHLNGSLKAGIAVRVSGEREVFDWMLEQHAGNMAIKGYVGPSVSFVRNMIASSPQDFSVYQAYIDNQPVSAILLARFGTHAETYLSWTGEAGRRSNAHHLLLWQLIVESKANGCRAIDLGGYTTSGKYGAYKRGMKGREYRLTGEWIAF